jgi:protein-tyrosine phosphatase
MAEGLMRSKAEKYNLNVEVDSAGFEPFHTGDPPDPRAISVMKNHGIDISGQKSRLFRKEDFDSFDRIFVMDKFNLAEIKTFSKDNKHMQKVDFVMNAAFPGENQQVPDPYYGTKDDYEKVYTLLDAATDGIVRQILNGK